MHRIVRQLKGKLFVTRRVRFTAEQIDAYNRLFEEGSTMTDSELENETPDERVSRLFATWCLFIHEGKVRPKWPGDEVPS